MNMALLHADHFNLSLVSTFSSGSEVKLIASFYLYLTSLNNGPPIAAIDGFIQHLQIKFRTLLFNSHQGVFAYFKMLPSEHRKTEECEDKANV